jgi:hypothetical protein
MPQPEQSDSPLDALQRKLYANAPVNGPHESGFSSMRKDTAEHWKAPPPPAPQKPKVSGAVIALQPRGDPRIK